MPDADIDAWSLYYTRSARNTIPLPHSHAFGDDRLDLAHRSAERDVQHPLLGIECPSSLLFDRCPRRTTGSRCPIDADGLGHGGHAVHGGVDRPRPRLAVVLSSGCADLQHKPP